MKLCRTAPWVLLLWTITSTGCGSAVPTVKVKLHDPVVLRCSKRCSGVVRWTVSHKPSEVLAECDQTSCRSVKLGYQIYNQDLKGNLFLITDVDFSKRGWYTCDCDGRDQCDVLLQVEALKTPVLMQSGGSLVMELEVSDPVEVIYSSRGSADGSWVQICTVIGGSLQCESEYTHRTSLSSSAALELRGMTPSDSGVYTIRTIRNKEDIHIYTVTVIASLSSVRKKPGDTLVLKLGVSVPVDVFYKSTAVANQTSLQICSVIGRSLNCADEYEQRASLTSSDLELRGMKSSDTGLYAVLDARNKEIVHGYIVTVVAPIIPVVLISGNSLLLELDVSDPVEVIYKKKFMDGPSDGQICTVDGGSLNCTDHFKERASLTSSSELKLRGMNVSECGDYIIQGITNKETIKTYTVLIIDSDPNPKTKDEGAGVPWWVWFVAVLVVVLGLTCCCACLRAM